jgi:hypothetical protein
MGIVRVIISKNKVYTTTHNTIVYEAKLQRETIDGYLTDESHDEINYAKSVAWNYANESYFNTNLRTLQVQDEEWSSDKVFDYLERLEKKETY